MEKSIDMDALAEYLGRQLYILAAMVFVMGIFFALGWYYPGWCLALPVAVIPFGVVYRLSVGDRFVIQETEDQKKNKP